MIFHPKPGQRVRLHYRRDLPEPWARAMYPHQGKCGQVLVAGRGPGPRNALVLLEDGTAVTVPRGNLQRCATADLPKK